jgi:crotonobetainyl-CoA:carnitine CoA-transferase CaiB-like acyl-CoA transferase
VENRATVVPLLNEILGERSADEWMKRFEAAGVPAGRIRTVPEVCESEHLKARGMIQRLKHPKAGAVTVFGVPIKLHATPGEVKTPPPTLGQHTDQVLRSLLKLKPAQIKNLHGQGAI